MNNRLVKLLALVLALMLVMSGCSMIEVDKEKDNAQTAAVVGGEVITKGEAQSLYDYYVDYYTYLYSMYGMSSDSLDTEALKQNALDALVEQKLVAQKAAAMGLDQLTDEQKAEVEEKANADFENYISTYEADVRKDEMTDEEARAATVAYLEENGITIDSLVENQTASYVANLLREDTVKDVTVSDEELKTAYDEKVAADESSYSGSAYLYERNVTNGTTVYWNPEGYRTVKHILFKLSDEQKAELTALETELSDLEKRIDALENPATEAPDATDAPETTAEPDATAEPEETMTLEELNALKADKEKEIEDKKAELLASFQDKIDEVTRRFADGESFDDLMAEFGEDPGMQSEPGKTHGYVVSADSTMWEAAFTEHAMAIEKPGELSEAFLGSNGVHIIYYVGDVTPGATPFEDVKDELSASTLTTKQDEAYNEAYEIWKTEAGVKTYPKVLDEHDHNHDHN